MGERRGTKALEMWCRRLTEGYPGVKVENMTTSWRDGLAFCAIIHHFRPDLIDFSKLNKDDVYYNNSLAFRIAERHLGIPALLDAEDMVEFPVPDRLSILTYLSQFYQVFVGTSGSPTRIVAKRPAVQSEGCLSPPSTSPPTKMAVRSSGALGRREPCAQCSMPVFLAERLNVGSRLYHRTCFRCARCNTQLSLANCYETETDGVYCCETCPDEEPNLVKTESSDLFDYPVLNKPVSDEEKTKNLHQNEEVDEYSSFFETALEGEESAVTKARKEWSSHMLDATHDTDDDDVVTEESEIQKASSEPASRKESEMSFKSVESDNEGMNDAELSPRAEKKESVSRKRSSVSPLEDLLKKARSRIDETLDSPVPRIQNKISPIEKLKDNIEVVFEPNFTDTSSKCLDAPSSHGNNQPSDQKSEIHDKTSEFPKPKIAAYCSVILDQSNSRYKAEFPSDYLKKTNSSQLDDGTEVLLRPKLSTFEKSSVTFRRDFDIQEHAPPLPKSKPPDRNTASLTTDIVNSVSKSDSVNSDIVDQLNTACEAVEDIAKDRQSLVKSRKLLFEVPSKKAETNLKTVETKSDAPAASTGAPKQDTRNGSSSASKVERDIERVSKYFGQKDKVSTTELKVKLPSHDISKYFGEKKGPESEKQIKDSESSSKYPKAKKVSFKTASIDNLKDSEVTITTKRPLIVNTSKSYPNFQTVESIIRKPKTEDKENPKTTDEVRDTTEISSSGSDSKIGTKAPDAEIDGPVKESKIELREDSSDIYPSMHEFSLTDSSLTDTSVTALLDTSSSNDSKVEDFEKDGEKILKKTEVEKRVRNQETTRTDTKENVPTTQVSPMNSLNSDLSLDEAFEKILQSNVNTTADESSMKESICSTKDSSASDLPERTSNTSEVSKDSPSTVSTTSPSSSASIKESEKFEKDSVAMSITSKSPASESISESSESRTSEDSLESQEGIVKVSTETQELPKTDDIEKSLGTPENNILSKSKDEPGIPDLDNSKSLLRDRDKSPGNKIPEIQSKLEPEINHQESISSKDSTKETPERISDGTNFQEDNLENSSKSNQITGQSKNNSQQKQSQIEVEIGSIQSVPSNKDLMTSEKVGAETSEENLEAKTSDGNISLSKVDIEETSSKTADLGSQVDFEIDLKNSNSHISDQDNKADVASQISSLEFDRASKGSKVDSQSAQTEASDLSSTLKQKESRTPTGTKDLQTNKNEYPVELNPFGDDDEEETPPAGLKLIKPHIQNFNTDSPVPEPRRFKYSTNPFENTTSKPPIPPQPAARVDGGQKKVIEAPKISLNPFWSDGEEPSDEETAEKPVPLPRSRQNLGTPEPKPRRIGAGSEKYDSNSSLSSLSSAKSSSIGRPSTPSRKKKPAPQPPGPSGSNTPKVSLDSSISSCPSQQSGQSPRATPRLRRKTRRAPLPPTSTPYLTVQGNDNDISISPITDDVSDELSQSMAEGSVGTGETQLSLNNESTFSLDVEREKIDKDEKNRNRQSQSIQSPESESDSLAASTPDKSTFGKWKRRKGPAPSRPVPQRRQIKPLPLQQLRHELELIELQQQGLEKQGVKLEQLIREKCEGPGMTDDAALTPEVEELVLELFELVNEKNELFRRQAELMYLRRQQRLEEEYADLEYQIRCLMDQPERNKTDSDKAREEELINRLVDVVERRNEIVECLEMDRVREAEEDQSISTRLNLIASKRDEESQAKANAESPVKLSKKEKKKMKKEKKAKEKGKNIDVDKDIDESETSEHVRKDKKKRKWF